MAINTLFINIADAIREKLENSDTFTPSEMPAAIRSIESGGSYELIEYLLTGVYPSYYTQVEGLNVKAYKNPSGLSTNIANFISNYARTEKIPSDVTFTITNETVQYTVEQYLSMLHCPVNEYQGNINSDIISNYSLTLLYDARAGATDITLLDSIENYKGIILNGIYQGNASSGYNTTMCYWEPILNRAYWTGMKDRNISYDCYVTFTSDTTATLSGGYYGHQCIIYGIN